MNEFASKQCVPCSNGTLPFKGVELKTLHEKLGKTWKLVDEHHLEKEFTFKNFEDALAFTNKVGAVAEEQGHHPDIHLSWGKVKITLFTHKSGGLTTNDFIMAAKIDELKI